LYPKIRQFIHKDYGLFLNTDNATSAIAVNVEDGITLFNEGCIDGYCGFYSSPINIMCFSIKEHINTTYNVVVEFIDEFHIIGNTDNYNAAKKWIDAVNNIIRQHKS